MSGNTNKKLKMALDAVMTLLLVLLMKISFTGLALHELIGLFLFMFFVIHKLLNFKWITTVSKKFFSPNTSNKLRFMFFLDSLLFLAVTAILVSGIAISQVVFSKIQVQSMEVWSDWHHFFAYISLILTSIHIGMHWYSIMGFAKKALRFNNKSIVRTWIARCFALFLAFLGVKGLTNPYIKRNFTAPFEKRSESSAGTVLNSDFKKDKTQKLQSPVNIAVATPTLEEYLGNLFCSGCSRRCSLLKLGCGRGNAYKNEAINEYNTLYTKEPDSKTESRSDNSNDSSELFYSESTQEVDTDFDLKEDEEEAGPSDYIGIMSLFIAGTYYSLEIPKNITKRRPEKIKIN